jgi:hypothetical protein
MEKTMPRLDHFESTFRAATKEHYHYTPISFEKIFVVTDLEKQAATQLGDSLKRYLGTAAPKAVWSIWEGKDYNHVGDLLSQIEKEKPDLICTYRQLKSVHHAWPYSLGEYLDILTQMTPTPVFVLPHPEKAQALFEKERLLEVMALTDHLAGNARLVDYGVAFTPAEGTLFLAHLEDEAVFKRYIDVIGKIPSLDTETAREKIAEQLLKEPYDYIQSCRAVLAASQQSRQIEPILQMKSSIADYKAIFEKYNIDLLVLNTKDADQMAMHGLAYPLAVEMQEMPMLML